MSIPAWVPCLDLNNNLELGPNCPEEDTECTTCPEQPCAYAKEAT